MLASDKPNRGGVSKITTSIPQFAITSRKCCITFDSNNSDGFGGRGPEGITHRFGMPTEWTNRSSERLVLVGPFWGCRVEVFATNWSSEGVLGTPGILNTSTALLSPNLLGDRLKRVCWVGRCKSASMSSVLFPALAIKIARLAAAALLPPPGR